MFSFCTVKPIKVSFFCSYYVRVKHYCLLLFQKLRMIIITHTQSCEGIRLCRPYQIFIQIRKLVNVNPYAKAFPFA